MRRPQKWTILAENTWPHGGRKLTPPPLCATALHPQPGQPLPQHHLPDQPQLRLSPASPPASASTTHPHVAHPHQLTQQDQHPPSTTPATNSCNPGQALRPRSFNLALGRPPPPQRQHAIPAYLADSAPPSRTHRPDPPPSTGSTLNLAHLPPRLSNLPRLSALPAPTRTTAFNAYTPNGSLKKASLSSSTPKRSLTATR